MGLAWGGLLRRLWLIVRAQLCQRVTEAHLLITGASVPAAGRSGDLGQHVIRRQRLIGLSKRYHAILRGSFILGIDLQVVLALPWVEYGYVASHFWSVAFHSCWEPILVDLCTNLIAFRLRRRCLGRCQLMYIFFEGESSFESVDLLFAVPDACSFLHV